MGFAPRSEHNTRPAIGALQWHDMGANRRHAWSTVGGGFCPHEFQIGPDGSGYFRLEVRQLGNGAPALPVFVAKFPHQDWTTEKIEELAEALRANLPVLGPESWLPIEKIRAQVEARLNRPTRCEFVHRWPLGAGDDDVCYCQKVTKGFYEEKRRGR